MSKEELIAAIQQCAKELGRTPKCSELISRFPATKMAAIRKHLGTYTRALEESGLARTGCGFEATMDDLFRDWAEIVRKMGRIPTMTEYEHQSKFSVRPLTGRFRRWRQVPRGMHKYAEQTKLNVEYGDVTNGIA